MDELLDEFLGFLGGIDDYIEGAADRVDKNPIINPPQDGDRIIVSENQHVIAIYSGEKKLRSISDFSTGGTWDGKPHPTPVGKFKVINKDADHTSSKYKDKRGNPAKMPLYVQFADAVGFHVGDPNVGSHGCIHLMRSDADFIFKWAKVGKTRLGAPPRLQTRRRQH